MILAQVGVRQHIVANRLAVAQATAMANHQPDLRTQNREVIGDRLRVRRANANVHERDTCAVLGAQVIGRHLVASPGRGLDGRPAALVRRRNLQPARHRQRRVARMPAQLCQRPVTERIDIAVIVREQNIMLEMLHRCAGVVLQAFQREIHPLRIEQREWPLAARIKRFAICHLVTDQRQLRRREPAHELRW